MNVKVQLAKPHTHAGTRYPENTVIEVTEPDAAWLREHGVALTGNKPSRWLKPVLTATDEDTDQ
jgi:hypothetical protein